MSDEENVSVEAEVSEAVAQAIETEEEQSDSRESAQDKKARNDAAYNWAEARRQMKELDRRNQEMQAELDGLKKPRASQEDDELDKLSDDDIVTKGHVKKLATKLAREIANETIKQREAATVDERLQLKYSDYTDVVTRENIELLKETEPELADTLRYSPDAYSQGIAAYKLLKKIGMGKVEKPNPDRERAVKNSQKPVSVNAVTKSSALGEAHKFENGLTPELKKQLREEMRQAMKQG